MPYANEIHLLLIGGGPYPTVAARMHDLIPPSQPMREEVTVQSSGTFSIQMTTGTRFLLDPNLGLVLQVPGEAGPLFRSGPWTALPTPAPADPKGFIDVVGTGPVAVGVGVPVWLEPADLPLTLQDGQTVVDSVTVEPVPGGITVTAAGTVSGTPFTHAHTFVIEPETSIWDDRQPLPPFPPTPSPLPPQIVRRQRWTSTEFSTGPVSTFFKDWLNNNVIPTVVHDLNSDLGGAATARIASVMSPPPAPGTGVVPWEGLPPTTVVSARSVVVDASGVTVDAAVGGMGDIITALFPQRATPKGGKCPLSVLALMPGANLDLAAFRTFRDERLYATVPGRALASLYRAGSGPLAGILVRHPVVARAALRAARALGKTLAPRSVDSRERSREVW